jgi:hypothetical protein
MIYSVMIKVRDSGRNLKETYKSLELTAFCLGFSLFDPVYGDKILKFKFNTPEPNNDLRSLFVSAGDTIISR